MKYIYLPLVACMFFRVRLKVRKKLKKPIFKKGLYSEILAPVVYN